MHVLAFDTATPEPAVAVSVPESTFVERLSDGRRASEDLLPAIEACLRRAGIDLSRCDRIAVCSGPGSFTGVRVGLATAWGLSRASGVPVEAVPTLAALAEAARRSGLGEVSAALDAGRGDVTIGAFSLAGPRAEPLESPLLCVSASDAGRYAAGRALVCLPAGLLPGSRAPGVPVAGGLAEAVARAPRDSSGSTGRAVYSRPSAAEEKFGAP
jgi:tRNA threonylcarbamoyl adenosine modification protein YeaZ